MQRLAHAGENHQSSTESLLHVLQNNILPVIAVCTVTILLGYALMKFGVGKAGNDTTKKGAGDE
jgi:hypothetical protein